MIRPKPLNPGDTLGVMSPSSYIDELDVQIAKDILEQRGYKTYIHPQTYNQFHQSAGTNHEKLEAFHDLIQNPDIDGIIFSTGGNRAFHWVDHINWQLVQENPKPIMGFSDITSILTLIHINTGLVTYHGPNLRWFKVHQNNLIDTEQCFDMLRHQSKPIRFDNHKNFSEKPISGSLVGGNAHIFQYLIHHIDFKDKILFLEDWNTETSHLDLLFYHLRRNKVFDHINALILGQFDNLLDTGRPFGFTFQDIVNEHTPKDLPIIYNAPFGHGERLITLPVGLPITINKDDQHIKLLISC